MCFGEYIFFDASMTINFDDVLHEYGHKKQSRILGPLYLIVIGIPSILRNIYDRIAHKEWLKHARVRWYYSHFPENWADRLAGIKRYV